MEPAAVGDHVPDTADLVRVMALLGLPGDPLFIVEGHTAPHLAGLSCWHTSRAASPRWPPGPRWARDWTSTTAPTFIRTPIAGGPGATARPPAGPAGVGTACRGRGPRPDLVPDTVATTLGTLIQLVEACRDDRIGRPGPPVRLHRINGGIGVVLNPVKQGYGRK